MKMEDIEKAHEINKILNMKQTELEYRVSKPIRNVGWEGNCHTYVDGQGSPEMVAIRKTIKILVLDAMRAEINRLEKELQALL
jgi:hypothetical protein